MPLTVGSVLGPYVIEAPLGVGGMGEVPPFAGAVELFDTPWALLGIGRPEYDVSPDGERFVMIRPPDRSAARIHVILNWSEELKRRVPR